MRCAQVKPYKKDDLHTHVLCAQQANAAAKAACSMNGKKALGKRLEVLNLPRVCCCAVHTHAAEIKNLMIPIEKNEKKLGRTVG